MSRGLIGKSMRGAAAVGVPMLMEEHRAQILARRDAVMQQYGEKNTAAQMEFQSAERKAGQDFTATENDRQRTLTREENSAARDQNAQQFGVTAGFKEQELGMEGQKLDTALKQAEQALETGKLGLVQAQRIEGLRDTLVNPESTEADLEKAAGTLNRLLNDGKESFSAITAYGEGPPDIAGNPTQVRSTGILDRRRGTVTPFTMGQPAGAAPPSAVNYLLQNDSPELRAAFDAKYGEGSAAKALGGN